MVRVNRAALPAIFNPEDLNALELALRVKDTVPGSTITILTMGPGRAAEIVREGLYHGADSGVLLTDRAFAGSGHIGNFLCTCSGYQGNGALRSYRSWSSGN